MNLRTFRLPAFLLVASVASATDVVTVSSFGEFINGDLDRVAVSSDGVVTPARPVREVADLGAAIAWGGVAEPEGGLVVATGPEPRLVRVSASGETSTVGTLPGALVRAVARAADGTLLAGASLPGSVFRIAPGGSPELVHDASEAYVWAILPRPDGSMLVATGSPARVLRLAPGHKQGDKPEVWFEPSVAHVTSLVAAPDGSVLASTSGDGLLVRLRGPADFTVIHAAEGAEVRGIVPLADGRIWFATFPAGGGSGSSSSSSAVSSSSSGGGTVSAGAPESAEGKPSEGASSTSAAIEAPSTNGGLLHEVDTRGFVLPLWAPARGAITALKAGADGAWWAGTNDAGRIYSGDGRRRWALETRLPAGREVAAVVGEGWILSSHPAKVFREEGELPGNAKLTLSPLDARRSTSWATVRAEDETGVAAPVTVRSRVGQTPRVDATWGPWVAAEDAGDGVHRLLHGPARYLQVELTLGEGARVSSVRAFHEAANQPPVVGAVQHHAFDLEVQSRQGPSLPSYDLERLARERNLPAVAPDGAKAQFRAIPRDGSMTFAWRVVDPDGDALRFAVELQRAGEDKWIRMAEELADTWVTLDLAGLGEGRYRARVIADDTVARAQGPGLTGQRLGDWFILDLAAPRLDRMSGESPRWVLQASDTASRITGGVLRSADGRERALAARDGAFDSRIETIEVKIPEGWPTTGLRAEVTDESGRRASLPLD